MRDIGSGSSSSKDSKVLAIDPYALVEALIGQKIEKPATPAYSAMDDYEELERIDTIGSGNGQLKPDSPPKDVRIGAVNPYALVEALLGRSIDKQSISSAKILASVLQTDYNELFDMKYRSVLFAGLKLNEGDKKAERLSQKDMKILEQDDLITPDLAKVQRLEDIEKLGFKDLNKAPVKMARMENGKLHLVISTHSLGKTLSNHEVTMPVNELVSPFRMEKNHWSPPNSSYRDMYDYFFEKVSRRLIGDLSMFQIRDGTKTMNRFDDPIQGCTANSWLIAALFSVFWSEPSAINRATRVHQNKEEKKRLQVKFHDKGGENNSKTQTVEVNYEIQMNNSNNEPLYCRSSDGADIWPSLYEKAFAKWVTGNSSEQPDITQTYCGDPVKAMAQINGREPQYYQIEKHSALDILGLVRANCLGCKTINPMVAWTYATGNMYRGSNVVANHAYSVLGFTVCGSEQYVVLRNPWGVTEPIGLTSYPGLLERLDPNIWQPASLLDHGGLFAMEMQAFKHCFSCIGIAK